MSKENVYTLWGCSETAKNELSFARKWIEMEVIMLNEIRHTQMNTVFSLILEFV